MTAVAAGFASVHAEAQDELKKQLERHPFFSKITHEEVRLGAFLFLVQRPEKEEAGYAARVAGETLALMQPAEAAFLERYATPFELQRRTPTHVVAILASASDFETYLELTEGAWHVDVRSTIDPVFAGAVLHEAPFSSSRDPGERARSARHAMAHLMENAYYGGSSGAPIVTWAFEGVAMYLAALAPDGSFQGPDPFTVREYVKAASDPKRRWENVRAIQEFVTISHSRRLVSWLGVETKKHDRPDPDGFAAWMSFYRQAGLLVTYLQEGDEQRYAPQFEAFWRAMLAGETDLAALASGFPREVLPQVDTDFLAWVAREHQALFPDVPIELQVLLGGDGKPGPGPAASPEAAAAVVAAGLAFEDATARERLALAIGAARTGRASEALVALEVLGGEAHDPELGSRIERERVRVAAWIELRDAFLTKCLEEQIQVQFEYLGKRSKTRIEKLEDGAIVLAPNRLGVGRLEVESIEPVGLARQMTKHIEGLAPEWVRVYPYVLQEDDKWKRYLKGEEEPEAVALAEDAAESYPELFRIASAAGILISIQELPELRGPSEAEAELAGIRALCADYGDVDLVDRRRSALRGRAQEVARAYFDLVRPWQALEGELEELDNGRVAITYDFSDPGQLLDFQDLPYLTGHGPKFGELKTEEPHGFRVEDGQLRGIGNASLRSLVDLETPVSVRYELAFEDVKGLELPVWYMNVGICDDGFAHFAWAMNIDYLEVWDKDQVESAYPEQNSALYMDEYYTLELLNDGKRVELLCEGAKKQELLARSRKSGATFLWSYTDFPVRIRSLRIEGRTSASSFERLKRAWVTRQLEGL